MWCNGQQLAITGEYENLYQIIQSIYGGDDRTYFNLPDLRGRVAVRYGQGDELSNNGLGQKAGAETTTLTAKQMAAHGHSSTHDHSLQAVNVNGSDSNPGNNLLAREPLLGAQNYHPGQGETKVPMESDAIAPNTTTSVSTGGAGSHQNVQPLLAVSFIICYEGFFPSSG